MGSPDLHPGIPRFASPSPCCRQADVLQHSFQTKNGLQATLSSRRSFIVNWRRVTVASIRCLQQLNANAQTWQHITEKKYQKSVNAAYWPFHKPECTKNEFADAVEEKEPKFAAWMRKHGKLAVLKDEEVDRLERAAASTTGHSRQEVMDSMYGRLVPSPKEPSYTAEETIRMRSAEEGMQAEGRLLSGRQKAWQNIEIDEELGVDCEHYKWQQNQTYVDIYALLPARIIPSQVEVLLQPGHLRVAMDGVPLLNGSLLHKIKQDESTWFIQDGILHITLLKRSRRGNYADGTSNAHTFWRSILKQQLPAECIALKQPPLAYYNSHWERSDGAGVIKPGRRSRPEIKAPGS